MLSGCVVVLLLSETLSDKTVFHYIKGSGSFLLSPKIEKAGSYESMLCRSIYKKSIIFNLHPCGYPTG